MPPDQPRGGQGISWDALFGAPDTMADAIDVTPAHRPMLAIVRETAAEGARVRRWQWRTCHVSRFAWVGAKEGVPTVKAKYERELGKRPSCELDIYVRSVPVANGSDSKLRRGGGLDSFGRTLR